MIAILTPSRGRRQSLIEMVEAAMATRRGSVEVYVGIDDDDRGYPFAEDWSPAVHIVRGPRAQLSEWTNRLAQLAIDDGHEILASFGDDHRPRTVGWDLTVEQAMRNLDGGLVYTRDGLQDERLPTAPFWSADVVRAVGFYCPLTMAHMYLDNYWLRLARDLCRCTYVPDVLIEHMHHTAGKTRPDTIYAANDMHLAADKAAFESLVGSSEYRAIVQRVKAAL